MKVQIHPLDFSREVEFRELSGGVPRRVYKPLGKW